MPNSKRMNNTSLSMLSVPDRALTLQTKDHHSIGGLASLTMPYPIVKRFRCGQSLFDVFQSGYIAIYTAQASSFLGSDAISTGYPQRHPTKMCVKVLNRGLESCLKTVTKLFKTPVSALVSCLQFRNNEKWLEDNLQPLIDIIH